MAQGPLAVRFLSCAFDAVEAGALGRVPVEVENAGTISWDDRILLAYHWLDERDNPIVWDGLRTPLPPLAPGERAQVDARVRGPIPPGRYGLSFDLVAEHRAWFSELAEGQTATSEVVVGPRTSPHHAELPDDVQPEGDWRERVAAAHAEGFAVVAGAVAREGGVLARTPRELAPYRPGAGRVPGFSLPLLCPSVVDGVELERIDDVAGLPAFAAPLEEPWLYDGRIVLRVRAPSRSGRRRA